MRANPFSVWEQPLGDGRTARALVVPGRRAVLVWWKGSHLAGAEEFDSPDEARQRAEVVREELAEWGAGSGE
jgi:hypothetical protein